MNYFDQICRGLRERAFFTARIGCHALLAATLVVLTGCNSAPKGAQYAAPDTTALGGRISGAKQSVTRASKRAERLSERLKKPVLTPGEREDAQREAGELVTDLRETESDLVAAENARAELDKKNAERTGLLNKTVAERDKGREGLKAMTSDRDTWRKRYKDEFGLWARITSHFWSALIGFVLGAGGIVALFITGKLAKLGARIGIKASTGL